MDSLSDRLNRLAPILLIDQKRGELAALQEQANASTLWDDQEQAIRTLARLNEDTTLLNQWDELQEFLSLDLEEGEQTQLEVQVKMLEQKALLSGVHDAANAILTVHAGTGGVDAQDWAEMLMRMFLRYVEQGSTEQPEERTLAIDRRNWKAEVIELNRAEEAGIKSVVIEVKGTYAFGLLKAEVGVHRLVRLSPFNAKNLRQTSFALVEVIPEVEQSSGVNIDEKELRIDVFRAGGHGGQGVNTTDSAVRITHLPTGIVVSVQNERSQHQNKATALTILRSKLARLQELQSAEETAMLKGEFKEGSWGNQIRSYVLQPYQMVKDHRTEYETSNVQGVLDGNLHPFIENYLIRNDPDHG